MAKRKKRYDPDAPRPLQMLGPPSWSSKIFPFKKIRSVSVDETGRLRVDDRLGGDYWAIDVILISSAFNKTQLNSLLMRLSREDALRACEYHKIKAPAWLTAEPEENPPAPDLGDDEGEPF